MTTSFCKTNNKRDRECGDSTNEGLKGDATVKEVAIHELFRSFEGSKITATTVATDVAESDTTWYQHQQPNERTRYHHGC